MLLGLDLGTSSCKALLLDSSGRVLGRGSSAYAVNAPQPGWAESSPLEWWRAVGEAVREAVGSHGSSVKALGLSGQMHGVVLCDGSSAPLREAMLWADARSSAQLELYRGLPRAMLEQLGNPVTVGMAGPSLLWLREHEFDVYSRAQWALQPKDWLHVRLTGVAVTEPSDASGTLLFDVARDTWASDVLKRLELRTDFLAPIKTSSEITGALTRTAAEHLGLLEGTPVVIGGADTACAMLGTGALEVGTVQLTVGSGAQIVATRDTPRIDSERRTHLFCTVAPNRWYGLAAMQNAGVSLERVRAWLGLSWAQAYEEAFSVPDAQQLLFLPYLSGERTPHMNPEARGHWVGLKLGHTRAHLMRAAFEGVAFAIKDGWRALETTEISCDAMRLAGGGTLDARWRQLLSDALEKPFAASEVSDASARGAALLAGVGVGMFSSVDEVSSLAPKLQMVTKPNPNKDLLESYERFRLTFQQLHPST
jgi:xylulokinase